jgi:hypothetical protein
MKASITHVHPLAKALAQVVKESLHCTHQGAFTAHVEAICTRHDIPEFAEFVQSALGDPFGELELWADEVLACEERG